MKVGLLIRVLLFVVVTLLLLYGLIIPALIAVGILGIFYNAYEYIFIAFSIDCYFSPEPISFWYTIVISGLVVGAMLLRPFVRLREPDLD